MADEERKDEQNAAPSDTPAPEGQPGEDPTGAPSAEGQQPAEGEAPANEEVEEEGDPFHIPDDFYYDIEEEVSRPFIQEECGLPENLVKLYHSFGYDMHRRDNLHVLDKDRICFISGNYLELLTLSTGEKVYVRSLSGFGIGACSVHPQKTHIALAEKGTEPNTCIYEYPSLKLFRILRNGTQQAYAYAQFTPDGALIATVGLDPDFLLTIWDWREERIVLRNKAFSQDIFRVLWSADLPGILTTAGTGHIKFWKMANTFTGLKLQGNIGKFGKVELSDIEGFVTMPDGKVLSGSEWGNLIVWEGDLIKVQICRKGQRPCHTGLIMQIIIDEGELMTIGTDGYIRTWEFEAVDTAECPYEGALFELEPMNELQVDPEAKLMFIQKVVDEETTFWYCQDANGAVWKLDLSFSHTSAAPQKILSYHAGAIVDCDVSPSSYLATTIGADGSVRVYDLPKRSVLVEQRFCAPGSAIIWVPKKIDPKSKTIVAGFGDGVVRILQIGQSKRTDDYQQTAVVADLELLQVLKPHSDAVRAMAYDERGKFFASSGDDLTLFTFHVDGPRLEPIGFARLPAVARKLIWRYAKTTDPEPTLLLFMDNSCVIEVKCPNRKAKEKGTFELFDVEPLSGFQMQSVAGEMRVREEAADKRAKYEQEKKARAEKLEEARRNGLATDEDILQAESDEKRMLQKLEEEIAMMVPIVPEVPSPIIQCMLDTKDNSSVWISLDDFDAGYLYKCPLTKLDPLPPMTAEEKKEEEARMEEIARRRKKGEVDFDLPHSALEKVLQRLKLLKPTQIARVRDSGYSPLRTWKFTNNGKRVVFGFKNGTVRVQLLKRPYEFSSFAGYWIMAFQDNDRGMVNRVQLSFDDSFLLSVGDDGTFFVTELMSEALQEVEVERFRARLPSILEGPLDTEDIDDPKADSIEGARKKAEWAKLVEQGEEKRRDTRRKVAELRMKFKRLKEQNEKLPEHMRIDLREYEILPRIRDHLMKERAAKLDLLYKETAFESRRYELALRKIITRYRDQLACELLVLKSFGTEHTVSTMRANTLPCYHNLLLDCLRKEAEEEAKREAEKKRRAAEEDKEASTEKKKQPSVVQDDTDRHKIKGARGLRLDRQLHFMQAAKAKREKRQAEWDALYAKKPPNNYEDPSDVAAIKYVRENMGDYKLKSSPNYTVPDHERRTAKKTRLVLLSTMRQLSERQADFNQRVLRLRDKKANIIQQLRLLDEELAKLANTLPESAIVVRLKISDLDDDEFPERAFDITDEKLINFKNQIDPPPPAPNEAPAKKPPPPPAPGTVEAEMNRADAYKTMTVVMEEGRRVLWLPVEKLLHQETYFTLHLPFPHRPEVTGLSVASLRPSEELTDHSVHRLMLDFKVQPDCVVISRAIGLSEAEAQRKMDAETETTLPITNIPVDSEANEVGEREDDDDGGNEEEEDYVEGTPQISDQDPDGMSSHHSKRHMRTAPLEHAQRLMRQQQALFTRNFLLADAGRLVRCFNADLRALRHQKIHLQFLLKRADLNLLTLYEEYKLLKDFEKSERGLAETYDQRLKERREVNAKVQEMNANLDGTKKAIEKLAEKETEIFDEFKAYLGDNHKFGDFLNKVFKKKIKRKTKVQRADGEEGDEDESSSSSEDSEWDESDEEDEDDMMDLDMCPPGCDQQDYDATIAFRERRLDVEDDTAEQKRLLDEQKKNAETLAKKQRGVEYALEQAVKDLQAFQIEKQSKLNVLERVVILRLDQITFYQDKGLPSDFGSALVFERDNIHNLRHRIQELEDEKKGQRKAKKDAKAKHIMLQKHKKIFQLEIENMMKKCDLMMIDKFGRVDNLEKMETIRINPKIEEITARVLSLQAHIKAAEEKAEDELREARDCYIAEMRENTKLISKTVLLFHELQNLHGVLDKQQKNMGKGRPAGLTEKTEISNMLRVAASQAEELNNLTLEISNLSRKAGNEAAALIKPNNVAKN